MSPAEKNTKDLWRLESEYYKIMLSDDISQKTMDRAVAIEAELLKRWGRDTLRIRKAADEEIEGRSERHLSRPTFRELEEERYVREQELTS